MKGRAMAPGARFGLAVALLVGVATCAAAPAKSPFSAAGTFVEGCNCDPPCACQLVGAEHGCQGVGVTTLSSGSYRGVNLAGAKIAYATAPAQWVRLYIDARNPGQRKAAEAFARAVYSDFGPIEAVKDARIAISGKGGRYTVTVDGGKIMKLTTEPVLGGDKRTPIVISNRHDPLHPTVKQAKTIAGTYKDGERSFELKDSNAYFAEGMRSSGRI